MPPYVPFGGLYPEPRRNEPVTLKAVNPLPVNAKSNDTGIAGRDGYTVLSRASRITGQRPLAGTESDYAPMGPNLEEEI